MLAVPGLVSEPYDVVAWRAKAARFLAAPAISLADKALLRRDLKALQGERVSHNDQAPEVLRDQARYGRAGSP